MILNSETMQKYSVDTDVTKHGSKQLIVMKCDICGVVFDKTAKNVFMSRRNSESTVDTCGNVKCSVKRREDSMMKRFGVRGAGSSAELRKKAQETCMRKFGTVEAMSSPDVQLKSKQKCFEKYGVKNIFELPSTWDKIKRTNMSKYGVPYSKSSDIVKSNTRRNNIIKYGVVNPMMLANIAKKTSTTWCGKIYDKLKENLDVIPLFSREEFIGFNRGLYYKFKCTKCNNEFENNYIGVSCYKCNPLPRSNIENEIKEFIQSIYSGIIRFNCRKEFENEFEIDVYIPQKNIAIEINGNYYHSEIAGGKDKTYHQNKTDKCMKKNIRLIHIFEDEWIDKPDIVKARLVHILNLSKTPAVYGRKCEVREVSFSDASVFLNKQHIQGSDKSSIRVGAYYNGELVSVMTFGKIRRFMGYKSNLSDVYELIRFASSTRIVGIGSKLLTHFVQMHNPRKIISYADKRWSNGNLYEKIGFKKVSNGVPNYWYINTKCYQIRYHRFNFRKSELSKKLKIFDPNLTEWENMKNNGWDRIWDCGSLKYEWKI